MNSTKLLPRRPYILRALYEWILDNNLTPYLVVDTTLHGVEVPILFSKNEKMVLNISPRAISNLKIGNYTVYFNASFNGISSQIILPIISILAIYSSENGYGIIFEKETTTESVYLNNENCEQKNKLKSLTSIDNKSSFKDTNNNLPKKAKSPHIGRPFLRIIS